MIQWHKLAGDEEIALVVSSKAAEAKHFLKEMILAEPGWSPPAGAIEAYPHNTRYAIYKDHHGIRGAIKLVCGNDDEGLPILEVWPELPLRNRRDIAELSILALDRRARGNGASFLPLAAEVWRYCRRRGIAEIWAELEPPTLAGYARFGWPFEIAGALREYWGGLHYPCRMNLAAAGESFSRRAKHSSLYANAVQQALRTIRCRRRLERPMPAVTWSKRTNSSMIETHNPVEFCSPVSHGK